MDEKADFVARSRRFAGPPVLHRWTQSCCDVSWITPERAWRWGIALALLWLGLLAFDVFRHTTAGVTDAAGEQLGRDFINYWSGAQLAAGGNAALAYDIDAFRSFQQSLVGPASEFKIYGYPPVAMLLCWPLSGLGFVPALAVWVTTGAGLCLLLLSRLVGWRIAALSIFAAPAVFLNVLSGQNGFFTASILGGGLLLLDRRPISAGCVLGLIAYKPQMGVLLPVALAFGGYWRAIAATAIMAAFLVGASAALLGVDCWTAFADQLALQRRLLEAGISFWHRMPTSFAAVRALGGGLSAAYAVQLASVVLAIVAVAVVWRSACAYAVKAATLIVATFLATPYAWDYDMVALIFAAAWLLAEVAPGAVRPWERVVLVALMLLPATMPVTASVSGLQIGPIGLGMVLLVLVRDAVGTFGISRKNVLTAPLRASQRLKSAQTSSSERGLTSDRIP